jgi:hypothetical protein
VTFILESGFISQTACALVLWFKEGPKETQQDPNSPSQAKVMEGVGLTGSCRREFLLNIH